MALIIDAAAIQQVFLDWSVNAKLQEAVISSDGATISLGDDASGVHLDARTKLTVATESRSCEYSAASIFLQIRNSEQSLVAYRSACKLYAVADVVKALDKAFIVSFFVPSDAVDGAVSNAATVASVATASETVTTGRDGTPAVGEATSRAHTSKTTESAAERQKRKEKEREREKRHRDGSSKSRSKSSDRHKSSSGGADDHSPKKKKKPDMVTNEQLFEDLNVVVDKRGNTTTDALADAIAAALSAKGFEITDKTVQLDPFKQRTAMIVADEIPVGNSASILRANNPRKDLARVLELYLETTGEGKSGKSTSDSKSQSKPSSSGNTKLGTSGGGSNFKPYLIGKKPIIVVPKGMTSPITLVNAHEFLCNAKFVPRDAAMKQQQQKGLRGPPTTFTRSIQTSSNSPATNLLEYEIIDNPRKLGADMKEWDRIVAVIVLGQNWQFKDWLKTPVSYNVAATLFDRVYGFFVSLEGDKLPPDVTNWAVHRAQINRDKRGLDSVTYASFWNGLDEWMKVYKAELLPSSEA